MPADTPTLDPSEKTPERRMPLVASDLIGVVLPTSRNFPDTIVRFASTSIGSTPPAPWPDDELERAGVDKLMTRLSAEDGYRFGYRLIAKLDSGGMGETYRAWDKGLGIPVVVKMPKRELRDDKELMARFTREISAMAAVPHESIVPIIDSGEYEGCPFVVMRFLPGGSLAEYRHSRDTGEVKKNPPGMLYFWLPSIAAALDHIHAKGMLHRDVKPGNIFLDGFLKPCLGDFGIAKVLDDSGGLQKEQTLTATQIAVGTLEYMAPELFQIRLQPDGRADQYALAVTVYEMLSGEKPFTGSEAIIPVEHTSSPVPPLSKKCPDLPRTACDAVHKALSKKPENRFATCQEFAAAVLADIKPLEPEVDTVRLLCPSCRNILKLPQKASGKRGQCPRCKSVMDVAADLGALWLENEARVETIAENVEPTEPRDRRIEKSSDPKPWWRWGNNSRLFAIAGLSGLVCGLAVGVAAVIPSLKAATTLSVQLAEEIAEQEGEITLAHITAVSDEVAEALGNHHGDLDLSGLTTLTDRQAESLAKLQGFLNLSGLTMLSDKQAEALARHKGGLSMYGLATLTNKQIEALAKYHGRLEINVSNTLSDEQVESLARLQGLLILSGLTTLSDRQAEALATYRGSLCFDDLTTLSDKQAEALAKLQGRLSFGRLVTLSDKQAEALAKHQGGLELVGLNTLTDKQAAALAKYQGRILGLESLTTLTDMQANALSEYKGYLFLRGLTTLSDKQAEALAKHQGDLYLDRLRLETLSEKAAEALRANPQVHLPAADRP